MARDGVKAIDVVMFLQVLMMMSSF